MFTSNSSPTCSPSKQKRGQGIGWERDRVKGDRQRERAERQRGKGERQRERGERQRERGAIEGKRTGTERQTGGHTTKQRILVHTEQQVPGEHILHSQENTFSTRRTHSTYNQTRILVYPEQQVPGEHILHSQENTFYIQPNKDLSVPRTAGELQRACGSGKRGLLTWQKRPTGCVSGKRGPYLYGKRGLLTWQKRATYTAKETCRMRKRQKRPTCMAKEAYLYGKRGLLVWQKRATYTAKETCRMRSSTQQGFGVCVE